MKKVLIILGLLITGFVVGYFTPRNETTIQESNLIIEKQNTYQVGTNLLYGQTDAVIKKVQTVDLKGGLAYEAFVILPEMKQTIWLDVNEIEFMILEEGDIVAINYVYEKETNTIQHVDWDRDGEGKLRIVEDRPIVVLDPGHGGKDLGQGSNDLWLEKEMNLKMTMYMAKHLEKAGVRVIVTRKKDQYMTLYDRSAIANYIDADLFISNHLNKYNEEASGVEIIYSKISDEALAHSIAEVMTGEEYPIYKVHNRKHDYLEDEDYYFLHRYTDVPSYIVEYGFADLEYDTDYITDHWMTMVRGVSDEIVTYLLTK